MDIQPGDVFRLPGGKYAINTQDWIWDEELTFQGFVVGTEIVAEGHFHIAFLAQNGKFRTLPIHPDSRLINVFRNGERVW